MLHRFVVTIIGIVGLAQLSCASRPPDRATLSQQSQAVPVVRAAPLADLELPEDVVPPVEVATGQGYPLSADQGFALRFYWLAMQDRFVDHYDEVEIYTRRGFYLGSYPERFVKALRMEGSGLLSDGRVINYAGRCQFGVGTCFEQLDKRTHPYGRGAGQRALIPFKSVAVDRELIPIGEPLYIPEFDGLAMPGGYLHDGCVRADDTGGGIKKQKIDFFVVSHANFRAVLPKLADGIWITPHIEHPRCEYLRSD